jgi:small-conductance mechanosensitive channel
VQHGHRWKDTYVRLLPFLIVLVAGAFVSKYHGSIRTGSIGHKLIALGGVLAFIIFATVFLNILTSAIKGQLVVNRLGIGRASAIQVILRIIGYVTILMMTLELVGISVAKLLLGGAIFGVIIGVAAQQALGNFFASIILIISHPFSVGQRIVLKSGSLGGVFEGKVRDIGLTHTRLKLDSGEVVYLPNATVLAGSSIQPVKPTPAEDTKKSKKKK